MHTRNNKDPAAGPLEGGVSRVRYAGLALDARQRWSLRTRLLLRAPRISRSSLERGALYIAQLTVRGDARPGLPSAHPRGRRLGRHSMAKSMIEHSLGDSHYGAQKHVPRRRPPWAHIAQAQGLTGLAGLAQAGPAIEARRHQRAHARRIRPGSCCHHLNNPSHPCNPPSRLPVERASRRATRRP